MINADLFVLAAFGVIIFTLGAFFTTGKTNRSQDLNLDLLSMWGGIIIIFMANYYLRESAVGKFIGISTMMISLTFMVGCIVVLVQGRPRINAVVFTFLAAAASAIGLFLNTLFVK